LADQDLSPLDSLELGIEVAASIFDDFLNLILKYKIVSLKNRTKESFSTEFTSKYSLAGTYVTSTWIHVFSL